VNVDRLKELLEQIRSGQTSPDDALEQLKGLPFEDLGFAKIDHHRALRAGMPEVIFGPGKSSAQFAEIFSRLASQDNNVLATRVSSEQVTAVQQQIPEASHNQLARTLVLRQNGTVQGKGTIVIVSAGTSDTPVAEEAAVTAEIMGNCVERIYDVGVAGLHRLLTHRESLQHARVLIVCAGMEGALPSVVGGLVGVPVIAVPTSIGYGASFGGVTALLAMMNSCASNVSVVNIDNGFGAAYVGSLINRL
jgi:pyridinium-3,5-biscarboxylic acid mononucleotide synthase